MKVVATLVSTELLPTSWDGRCYRPERPLRETEFVIRRDLIITPDTYEVVADEYDVIADATGIEFKFHIPQVSHWGMLHRLFAWQWI